MRSRLRTGRPARPLGRSFTPTVHIARSRLIGLAGETWRASELAVDDFSGIKGKCSLAHRLPTAV